MNEIRNALRLATYVDEKSALTALISNANLDAQLRARITQRAVGLVKSIRNDSAPSMMELFLGEYGLSSDEGVALMCLAEALLRVPDPETMDELIEDKIAPSAWGGHLGKSHSSLVNASTWALYMTGKVLNEEHAGGVSGVMRGAIKRLGEPVIRQAVTRAMKEMGRQFVLGETIEKALVRAKAKQAQGYTYSYDMLGEAARTDADARRYHVAYADAIGALATASTSSDIRENPGISIKLSALHPRYEQLQKTRVMEELLPRAVSLAVLAKSAGIGLNIDAEEAARLDLSLDLIAAMLSDASLKNWDGFGVVVQAYSKRAPYVIDWLNALATKLDRRIMVRLVKGAYWDTEIKLAQVEGLPGFPVFTRKASTDVSYLCCAKQLLGMTDRIYPQFATHNAQTVAGILELAKNVAPTAYEFQRLHGMGEALHDTILQSQGVRCRIYAPVGAHRDLLAYLVRRLLENGANSSFVNQIVDETVAPELVAADPFQAVAAYLHAPANPAIKQPADLFAPERRNSSGWDLSDPNVLSSLENALLAINAKPQHSGKYPAKDIVVTNPATDARIGSIHFATKAEAIKACENIAVWDFATSNERANILRKAADLYEENADAIFACLQQEAGKTLIDCVGELREAVDFLRYYAAQADGNEAEPLGIITCISPWNFPLAIFTGQIAAALAAGNGVLAKPAESTSLMATYAASLLHQAGVPTKVFKLVPGLGAIVGDVLTSHPRVSGVCFTGSTETAQRINRNMALHLAPDAPLIAETGGLNAMIVDSTALPEQAVRDIVASAFQSAGQRCSALRVLYVQKDIKDGFLKMLTGAMKELCVDDPVNFAADIGPVIDAAAQAKILNHIEVARSEGRLIAQTTAPKVGTFVPPTLLAIESIRALKEEIFGPVLHFASFDAADIETVIDDINATGFGLTFGLHSRIDDRVQHVIDRVSAGNIYVNRNQIGAAVGSQPFGGEGLSGTGPKAGGPRYLDRFRRAHASLTDTLPDNSVTVSQIKAAFDAVKFSTKTAIHTATLPGPTGESNRYILAPRKHVLCLGPGAALAQSQAETARALGCAAVAVAAGVENGLDGGVSTKILTQLPNLDAVVSATTDAREIRIALSMREGPIVPLLQADDFAKWLVAEKCICIDTTAAGGNAALLTA